MSRPKLKTKWEREDNLIDSQLLAIEVQIEIPEGNQTKAILILQLDLLHEAAGHFEVIEISLVIELKDSTNQDQVNTYLDPWLCNYR